MIEIILFNAIYAISSPFNKILVGNISPMLLVGLRQLMAGSILQIIRSLRTGGHQRIAHKDRITLVKITIFTMFIPNMCRFWSLQYMTSIKVNLLYNLAPFITYLLSYWLVKERVTWRKTIGLVVGSCGFLPLLLSGSHLEGRIGGIGFISWPELAMIAGVTSDCFGYITISKLVRQHAYSPITINSIVMLGSGSLALIASAFFEKSAAIVNPKSSFAMLGIIVLTSNVFSHNVYCLLLRRYSATFLSLCDFLRTIFATMYGCLFLREQLSLPFITSALIVFVGLILFYQEELKETPAFFTPSAWSATYLFDRAKSMKDRWWIRFKK